MVVNCVAYEKGRRLCDLQLSEVRNWLNSHTGFVWVALRDATDEELASAKSAFQLPDEALEEARRVSQRPIIAEYDDDILFAVLKLVEYSDRRVEGWRTRRVRRPALCFDSALEQ